MTTVRLNASPARPEDGRCAPAPHPRACLECGAAYVPATAEAEFCSAHCRMAFNNRRAKRGAELYDLFMALRHDRAVATTFKVWRLLNRLAAGFRAEDVTERAGRRSWRPPAEILARRPYLTAERLAPRSARTGGRG